MHPMLHHDAQSTASFILFFISIFIYLRCVAAAHRMCQQHNAPLQHVHEVHMCRSSTAFVAARGHSRKHLSCYSHAFTHYHMFSILFFMWSHGYMMSLKFMCNFRAWHGHFSFLHIFHKLHSQNRDRLFTGTFIQFNQCWFVFGHTRTEIE